MDGVLVIDKPSGWTSHDVVAKVRNLMKIKKVGHTGTLDPFATGVLPLTLSRATRLSNYFLTSDKVYQGVMRFGFSTSTYDLDGEPTSEPTEARLDAHRISEIVGRYMGKIRQTIPPYSAKKIGGRPMYSYARKGIELEPATKEVTIRELKIFRIEGSELEFELTCSAGTYARSLAHDLGKDYGCGAHLIRLRRTKSGEFPMESAAILTEGTKFSSREDLLSRVIPLKHLLNEIPAIVLSPGDRERAVHGNDLNVLTEVWNAPEYRLLDTSEDLIALAKRVQAFISPVSQPANWVRIHPHIILAEPRVGVAAAAWDAD